MMSTNAKPVRFLGATLAVIAGLTSSVAGAQRVAGGFSPNPAQPGDVVTFTATDSTGLGFAYSCGWFSLYQGAPDGPEVPLFDGCGAAVLSVGANESVSYAWDQRDRFGNLMSPGEYWFEVRSLHPVTFAPRSDWFCLSIQDAAAPALRQSAGVRVASSTELFVESPQDPGAWYRAAASLTSNRPFDAFGLSFCLSPDPLLRMSLANPGSLFTNGVGTLDAMGRSVGLRVNVPNDPSLAYLGFHVQVLLGSASGRRLTNDLAITILP